MAEDDTAEISERLSGLAHLSSAVGHHVINAYSAIVSNAEILRLTAQAGAPVDPLIVADMIIRTAVEAAGVARRLIDFTRPVTYIGDRQVALDDLLARFVADRRSPHALSLSSEAVPSIRGDSDQLLAMIGHIVANAEESMIDSLGTITLSTAMDTRGWIAVEITDSGPGMAPEVVERAVEPFFTTKNGRMGVGLSIANGIWRRHRGTLAIKSRPGEGTRVRLCVDPNEGPFSGLR